MHEVYGEEVGISAMRFADVASSRTFVLGSVSCMSALESGHHLVLASSSVTIIFCPFSVGGVYGSALELADDRPS